MRWHFTKKRKILQVPYFQRLFFVDDRKVLSKISQYDEEASVIKYFLPKHFGHCNHNACTKRQRAYFSCDTLIDSIVFSSEFFDRGSAVLCPL